MDASASCYRSLTVQKVNRPHSGLTRTRSCSSLYRSNATRIASLTRVCAQWGNIERFRTTAELGKHPREHANRFTVNPRANGGGQLGGQGVQLLPQTFLCTAGQQRAHRVRAGRERHRTPCSARGRRPAPCSAAAPCQPTLALTQHPRQGRRPPVPSATAPAPRTRKKPQPVQLKVATEAVGGTGAAYRQAAADCGH